MQKRNKKINHNWQLSAQISTAGLENLLSWFQEQVKREKMNNFITSKPYQFIHMCLFDAPLFLKGVPANASCILCLYPHQMQFLLKRSRRTSP